MDLLQHGGDAQQIAAVPDREPLLRRVDQHHPADRAVDLGERAPRDGGQVHRSELVQSLGRVDLREIGPLLLAQHLERRVVRQLPDLRDERQLAALHLGRARQEIVDGRDLTDDVRAGGVAILLPDSRLDRFDLLDTVGEHDGGRGPAAEEAVEAAPEPLRLLGGVELGVELAEVVLERVLQEVAQAEHRDDRQHGEGGGDRAGVAPQEAVRGTELERGVRRWRPILGVTAIQQHQHRGQRGVRRDPAEQRARPRP